MLWDLKDLEGQPHATMMACFTDIGEDSEALQGSQGQYCYRVVIKNLLQWYLKIDNNYHRTTPQELRKITVTQ